MTAEGRPDVRRRTAACARSASITGSACNGSGADTGGGRGQRGRFGRPSPALRRVTRRRLALDDRHRLTVSGHRQSVASKMPSNGCWRSRPNPLRRSSAMRCPSCFMKGSFIAGRVRPTPRRASLVWTLATSPPPTSRTRFESGPIRLARTLTPCCRRLGASGRPRSSRRRSRRCTTCTGRSNWRVDGAGVDARRHPPRLEPRSSSDPGLRRNAPRSGRRRRLRQTLRSSSKSRAYESPDSGSPEHAHATHASPRDCARAAWGSIARAAVAASGDDFDDCACRTTSVR